jgi:two-component system CheB/CheR fusion protein
LGTSETVSEYADLFAPIDRKARLYQRKAHFQGVQRPALSRFMPSNGATESVMPALPGRSGPTAKLALRELTEQTFLQQLAPVGALVNAQGELLYLQGRTGMYLEPTPGEAGISNVLKMARAGLRRDLTLALHQASSEQKTVRVNGLNVKTNGHFTLVNLSVCPVLAILDTPLYLVMLEAAPNPVLTASGLAPDPALSAGVDNLDLKGDASALIAELSEALRVKEEYLRSANEELETSNEELKSSNEEMQSVNEELQSSNEELETSKEELQSINEELNTVNTELQSKVMDMSRVNNDMNNLLAGTGIGTIFVDHSLRILRFTPTVEKIINLIPSDVGRPVGHIVSNLVGYSDLVADVKAVLKTLVPKEITVQTLDAKTFIMRIRPYRTLENVIEGAVITFVDITEMEQTRNELKHANALARLAVVVRDAIDAMTVQDLDGRIIAWNPGAVRLYGWTELEALQLNVRARIPKAQQPEALERVQQLSQAQTLEPYRTQRLAKDGQVVEVTLTASALVNETGRIYAIATTERRL